MKELYKALAKFHTLVPDIKKESSNPYFKSKYAALDTILPAIKEPLAAAGLVIIQTPCGDNELETVVAHVESGESITGRVKMLISKQDIQGQGAAITYMRRFAIVSMLGLNAVEDTDGEDAVVRKESKAKPKGYVEELGF